MAYTFNDSLLAVETAKNLLLNAADRTIDTATLLADAALTTIIADPVELEALITNRIGKEWYQTDATLVITPAVAAVGGYDITASSTGDGNLVCDIGGVPFTHTPTGVETADVMGDAMVILIDAGGLYTAVNTTGTLVITAVTAGLAGNAIITDASTDSTAVGTPTDATGGLDQVITAGATLTTLQSLTGGFIGTSSGV